ncbi:hypothetical protein ACFVXG_27365 [Kitasatospora sp. NPDC058162]|uniref:hypothetical protein n=1 Tax=Kitasatospora sp. NPDC058162 TaxID=3346362 RepID=UPI0036D90338
MDALAADTVPPTSSASPSPSSSPTGQGEEEKVDREKLIDGFVAEVTKAGETYTARIYTADSELVMTLMVLSGSGREESGQYRGYTFTLDDRGRVHATKNGGGPTPGGDNPGGQPSGGPTPGGDNPGGQPSGQPKPGGDNPSGQPSGAPKPGGDNPAGQPSGAPKPGGQGTPGHGGGDKQQSPTALPPVPKGGVKAGVESVESVESRAGMLAGGVGLIGAGATGIALVLRRRDQA